jgi:hypothetical protein
MERLLTSVNVRTMVRIWLLPLPRSCILYATAVILVALILNLIMLPGTISRGDLSPYASVGLALRELPALLAALPAALPAALSAALPFLTLLLSRMRWASA